MTEKLKILLASSEVHPYAKTGGLADVSSALPKALKLLGHDIRIILPKYQTIDAHKYQFKLLDKQLKVPVGASAKDGYLWEGKLAGGVPVYCIGNDEYFHRKELYGENGKDYPDNAARFIFFSRSVLETCKSLDFRPDIIHCHDWQTGLIAPYLKTLYQTDSLFQNTKTVFTIHNMAYQGNFEPSDMALTNLPLTLFNPEGVEFYGKISFLKAGLVYSDLLTTVSPTYGKEIQTPELGYGFDGFLRNRSGDFSGILNGVDYEEFHPGADPLIIKNFDSGNLSGKLACRENLARKFSLDIDEDTPILSMITRLCYQKGLDLVQSVMEEMLSMDVRFVVLGTGDPEYRDYFRDLPKMFPGKCASHIGFEEKLAREIYAGSDMLLLPSRYEPCGLTQLYALKYGTVPLVRAVGGLADSIEEFDPDTGRGTGFKFIPFETKSFLETLRKAVFLFKFKDKWRQLMVNGMSKDNGWNKAAENYSRLFARALGKS